MMTSLRPLSILMCALLPAIAALPSVNQDDPLPTILGKYVSLLHPGSSTLAVLTYLFQGLPESVVGVDFGYDLKESASFERYLASLLDSPTPAQKDLGNWATFVASRVYLDKKQKPFLVMTKSDRMRLFGGSYMTEPNKLSHNDKLLRDALSAYCRVARDRQMALSIWKSDSGFTDEPVRSNVGKRLKEIVVSNTIHEEWSPSGIWR